MASPPLATDESPLGLPAGWQFPHDLSCPTCNYNLRGLDRPRCPECGLVYRWQQLTLMTCPRCARNLAECDGAACPDCALELDWAKLFELWKPAAVAHFEYAKRPLRRFVPLLFSLLLPHRFWSKTPLEMPPAISRLTSLRAWSLLLLVLGAGTAYIIAKSLRPPGSGDEDAWPYVCLSAVFPLISLFAIPLFAPTLSKFNIRRDRLIRISAFLSALLIWVAFASIPISFALCIAYILNSALPSLFSGQPPEFLWDLMSDPVELKPESLFDSFTFTTRLERYFNNAVATGILIFLAIWIRHLYVILRVYLRLDRPNARAVFASVLIIGTLATMIGLSLDERALTTMGNVFLTARGR